MPNIKFEEPMIADPYVLNALATLSPQEITKEFLKKDLKKLAKELELKVSGNEVDLVNRILDHISKW